MARCLSVSLVIIANVVDVVFSQTPCGPIHGSRLRPIPGFTDTSDTRLFPSADTDTSTDTDTNGYMIT